MDDSVDNDYAARRAYVDGPSFKDDVAAVILAEETWRAAWDVNRAMCDNYVRDRAAACRAPMDERRDELINTMINHRIAAPPGTELDNMVRDDMNDMDARVILAACDARRTYLNDMAPRLVAAFVDGVINQTQLLKNMGLVGLFAKNMDMLITEQNARAAQKLKKGYIL